MGKRGMGKGKKGISKLRVLAFVVALSFYPLPFTPSPFPPVRAERIDSAAVSTATREGRLAVFDDVWSRINERYYDRGFHGLDWEAQRAAFRSLAAEAGSGEELYAVLRRMIATLNDPHTRVFSPAEKFDWWRPRFVTTGLGIAEIDGLPTVVKVERGSAPQQAGVRVGDVIERVNGQAAATLLESRLTDLAASASSRFRAFAKLLDGPPQTLVEVSWKAKDGKQKSARFERHWEQRELGVRMRRESGEYVVVEIDAFTKPIAVGFARVLKEKLNGARGVILDLRGNGGGDAEAMIGHCLHFSWDRALTSASSPIALESASASPRISALRFLPSCSRKQTSLDCADQRTYFERGRNFCRSAQDIQSRNNCWHGNLWLRSRGSHAPPVA